MVEIDLLNPKLVKIHDRSNYYIVVEFNDAVNASEIEKSIDKVVRVEVWHGQTKVIEFSKNEAKLIDFSGSGYRDYEFSHVCNLLPDRHLKEVVEGKLSVKKYFKEYLMPLVFFCTVYTVFKGGRTR